MGAGFGKIDINLGETPATKYNKNSSDTYKNSIIPDGTIKRGYDVFSGDNFTSMKDGYHTFSAGDGDARDCGKKDKKASEIFTTDDKWHKGEHRYVNCGLTCWNCDAWSDQSNAPRGPIKGVKVPIGSNLYVQEGKTGSGPVNQVTNSTCYQGKNQQNTIGWDWGDYLANTKYPEKLPDEVATGCAGGNKLIRGKYPKTLNGFKIQHDVNDKTISTDDCYLGTKLIKKPGRSYCLRSDLDHSIFCQMGDYISTESKCNKLCNKEEGKNTTKYCDFGYERLCQKRIGDPLKRDDNGNIVYSTKDYIKDDPNCKKYCGLSASAPNCKKIKNNICSRNPQEWKKPGNWIPSYCREYWQKNPDRTAMNKACKAELLKEEGEQNIWSGNGCGKLCRGEGTDVDTDWCNTIKAEYCRKNDKNMLTDDCYEFCSKNPDFCDDYLGGEKGMCNRLGIKTQEDLEKPVEGTLKNISDWCGCMMPRSFYEKYAKEIDSKFNEYGYSILSQIDLSPECMYPKCKQGSIMTKAQYNRKKEGMCIDCVQIMLQNLDGSFINSDFVSEQGAGCGEIKKMDLLPGVYNVKDIDKYIRVFDDKSYCEYPDAKSREDDKKNHNFKSTRITDKVGDTNISKGTCQLTPGFYKVKSTGEVINVHSDRTYCIFPPNFKTTREITEVDSIPRMNEKNTKDDCEYSETSAALADGLRDIGIGDFTNEEAEGIVSGFFVALLLIFISFILLIVYIVKKKRKLT